MSQTVKVELVDDLTGEIADGTVEFAIDGVIYEIDLTTDNAGTLRGGLADFVANARNMGKVATVATRRRLKSIGGTGPTKMDREQSQAIRVWAKQAGYTVSDRGRIPASIVADYQEQAGRRQQLMAAVG